MTRGRWIRLSLVSLLALAALAVILRDTDWAAFIAALAGIRPESLVKVILLQSIALAGRGVRWWSLLNSDGRIPLFNALRGTAIGAIGNHCLPARGGELLRAYMVGRVYSGGTEFALGTIVLERVLGAVLLGVITFGVVLAWPDLPRTILGTAMAFLAAGMAIVAALVVWPRLEQRTAAVAARLVPSWLTRRLGPSAVHMLAGVMVLQRPRSLVIFMTASLVTWGLDIAAVMVLGSALGIALSPGEGFLFLAGIAMSGAIPALPGNLGVYELASLAILSPLGVPKPLGLAFALTYKGTGILQSLIWGGGAWFSMGAVRRQARCRDDGGEGWNN
ncbi:MAG: flippase-like domain-containing protein [Magnetospirillum sp.]|nr:MAG: flippase-like domain-containing protein [Magnetospirillum sp.]